MLPLVKGRLVVVPNLVPRVSRFQKQKDQNPFRFLLSYRARNVGIKGAGDLEEEKKGGRLDSLFSFALFSPSLLAPATQDTSQYFFVEIWQSGRSRRPASCQLRFNWL